MSDLIKELAALDENDLSFRWAYSKERIDQAIAEISRLRLDVQAMRPLSLQCDRMASENARLRETLGLTVTLFKQIMDAIEADPVETVLIARRDGAEVKRITVQECFDKTRALLGKKE